MNDEILMILDSIEREKGIPKEVLFEAIESALLSAARKILGKEREDITVAIDRKTGTIRVSSGKKEIESGEFGRIAAQTAKQVIIQKIREAEREIIFDDYHKRVGNIVTGSVHRFEKGNIIVDLGKTEGVLPRSEQCPNERYKQGDIIRAYVVEVVKTNRGPQIILSRSQAAFVKRLFEQEVPEISEGIVEIKAISREAGERTKMAVYSRDEKIDPVGACVGMRGNRVKDVVKELHGEKIDIINWSEDIAEYLKAALNPAQISKLRIDKENKAIDVIVKDDQLSIAIGRHGQNVRLASKLIDWELNIRSGEVEIPQKRLPGRQAGKITAKTQKISSLDGVGKKAESTLIEAGFATIEKIAEASVEDLVKLDGIGKKKAEKIVASAKKSIGEKSETRISKSETKPEEKK